MAYSCKLRNIIRLVHNARDYGSAPNIKMLAIKAKSYMVKVENISFFNGIIPNYRHIITRKNDGLY